jgi:3-oxoacyl-[acyl-carrier-protein] synthase II
VGVFIGSGIGGLHTIEEQHKVYLAKGPGRLSPFMIPMLILNMGSGLFSMYHDLRGPNVATCSACATGTTPWAKPGAPSKWAMPNHVRRRQRSGHRPVGLGRLLRHARLEHPQRRPQHASRPFDRDRDGFVMGEGGGVVVLEELEHAKARGARIYAEMAGYGNTADAHHLTAPSPGRRGPPRCMNMALRSAGLNPSDISYINAHGTSTPQGDVAETQAIKTVFGEHAKKLAVSSTKGATGHMLGAAGAVEMALCVKAIECGMVPPTINLENPDPECDLDYVPGAAREMPKSTRLSTTPLASAATTPRSSQKARHA